MNITCCGRGAQYNVLLSDVGPILLVEELSGPATIIELYRVQFENHGSGAKPSAGPSPKACRVPRT